MAVNTSPPLENHYFFQRSAASLKTSRMHAAKSITAEGTSKVQGEVGTTAQPRNQSLHSFNATFHFKSGS